MRIVDTDSFGRDYPDEKFLPFIPKNIGKEDAQKIADIINELNGENSQRYLKVVDNDYIIDGPFEP